MKEPIQKELVMNPKILPILSRRSIRRYTGEPVSDDDVRALLEAAMAAPSAMATDPWRFLVVRDRAALAALAEILPHGTLVARING
jgi:nitroreductase